VYQLCIHVGDSCGKHVQLHFLTPCPSTWGGRELPGCSFQRQCWDSPCYANTLMHMLTTEPSHRSHRALTVITGYAYSNSLLEGLELVTFPGAIRTPKWNSICPRREKHEPFHFCSSSSWGENRSWEEGETMTPDEILWHLHIKSELGPVD
jgi:hypothetical protein